MLLGNLVTISTRIFPASWKHLSQVVLIKEQFTTTPVVRGRLNMGHQRASESCLLCMNTHPATILKCVQRTNSRPLEVSTCKSDSRWICNLLHSNRLVRKLYHDDQTEPNVFFKICIFTIHHHTLPYFMTCLLWANPWDFWHKGQVTYSLQVSSFTMMLLWSVKGSRGAIPVTYVDNSK